MMKKLFVIAILFLAIGVVSSTENNEERFLDFDDDHFPEYVATRAVPRPNIRAIERFPIFNGDIKPMDFDDDHFPEYVALDGSPIFLDFDDDHFPEYVALDGSPIFLDFDDDHFPEYVAT